MTEKINEKIDQTFMRILKHAENFYKLQPFFYDKSKIWWLWSDKNFRYEIVDEIDILNAITDLTQKEYVETKLRSKVLEALKQYGRRNIPLEPKKYYVQFQSEVVNLKTKERFKATPKYLFTNPLPFKIGEIDETPILDNLFSEWVSKENVQTLYEIIAFCMISFYPFHRIICLIGEGANGKSTFQRLVEKFIGKDNVCSTNLELLINGRFESTKLFKKLVCNIGEISYINISKTELLKRLTGEDKISFEIKNKNPFDDYNYATILIGTNIIPRCQDTSRGWYRRWLIVNFPNEFTEKRDVLSEIPSFEYENLGNKLIKIASNLLIQRKFTYEKSLNEKIADYNDRSNPLIKYIDKYYTKDNREEILFNTFYNDFVEYLQEENKRILSSNLVGNLLKQLGYEKIKLSIKKEDGTHTTQLGIVGLKKK